MDQQPTVKFIRLIADARTPKRAERSAAGYLPSRAMRYCDALTSATGYGYWVFPPLSFRLIWDGEDDAWMPVSGTDTSAVQVPDFADRFDAVAPEWLLGYAPPFLTALPELGGIQIWTGLLARTRPGWSLNVRAPVNLPPPPGLVAWEGLVETDIWFGPLFNNFRITKTDTPVVLRANVPFLQVQPVPQVAYRDEVLNAVSIEEPAALDGRDWEQLGKVLLPTPDWEARQGEYAVTVRRRRACPFDHRGLLDAADQPGSTPANNKP